MAKGLQGQVGKHRVATQSQVGAAELTVANREDNEVTPLLLEQLPWRVRYGLGDTHDNLWVKESNRY